MKMKSNQHPIEDILQQMPLRAPSRSLDQAVFDTVHSSEATEVMPATVPLNRQFGKIAFVVTALAACQIGVLIGHYGLPKRPAEQLQAAVLKPNEDLTKVTFNPDAFSTFHGHSTRQEYSDCSNCHKADIAAEKAAIEGLYYGDQHMFDVHKGIENMAKCSTCHVVAKPKPEPELPDSFPHDFGKLNEIDCRACHAVAKPKDELPKFAPKFSETFRHDIGNWDHADCRKCHVDIHDKRWQHSIEDAPESEKS